MSETLTHSVPKCICLVNDITECPRLADVLDLFGMFRKIILGWLIICTFGYSSAWAFDTHTSVPEQYKNHVTNVADNVCDGADSACDHCCHAASHLTGLSSSQLTIYIHNDNRVVSFDRTPYVSLPTSPPYHPPRS